MAGVSARDYASQRRRVSDGAGNGAEKTETLPRLSIQNLTTRRGAALTMQVCLVENAMGLPQSSCALRNGTTTVL